LAAGSFFIKEAIMAQGFWGKRSTDGGESESLSSETRQFVEAVLGTTIRTEREMLEWLATISPRHEAELYALRQAEHAAKEAAREEREQLNFQRAMDKEFDKARMREYK
jgi:hypothetical protein